MNVQHLDHLNLTVRDFDATAAWYARIFGAEIVERGTQDGHPWGVIRAGDAMWCAYERPDRRRPTSEALDDHDELHIAHFGVRISDRDAWERVLEREQPRILFGGAYPWPHSTSWYIKDPDDYTIEVVLWDDDEVAFS